MTEEQPSGHAAAGCRLVGTGSPQAPGVSILLSTIRGHVNPPHARFGRVGVRITAIEPFVCDGGLREFGFLKVTTDEGIVCWAETYDWHTSASLKTALEVMGRRLIGEDPRRIELMNERIWYGGRPGVPERQKVLAAIDLALWDIKAKWLGVPVYELLGRLFRDRIPLYWSHFATYRAVWPEVVGQPVTSTYAEWAAGARDVVAQGYKVLKTNLIAEGGPDGRARLPRYLDGAIDNATIDDAVTWIGTLRDVVGPGIGIAVDVQFDYRMGGAGPACPAPPAL